ncbi:MAG: S8 family serine peptidase [Gemmataceae bacterium]|nr:S8 family serine peptidase [Gemmataceae bacterium]
MTRPNKRAVNRKAQPSRPRALRPRLEWLEERTLLDASALRPVIAIDWQGQPAKTFANEWVVRFDGVSGSPAEQLQAGQARLSGLGDFDAVQYLGDDGLFLVRGPEQGSFKDYTELLLEVAGVEALEPNFLLAAQFIPNDTRFGEQWALRNTGQTIQGQIGLLERDIDATDVWDFRAGGSSSLIVAVLDTGVDYTHPDLDENIFLNPGEIAGNGIDDDGNGFVDDTRGWDFMSVDNDPMDTDGHGTHVAGIISAEGNNDQGVAGVAYGVKILPLKSLSAFDSGSTAAAIAAVNYVSMMRDRGFNIRLANNSYGTLSNSAELQAAIDGLQTRGILFVTAAGNTATNNDVTPFYPGSYSSNNILAVAATDNRDNVWVSSSYGATTVDLAAPGVNILSTLPGGGYGYRTGTSMAAAHVAGAAAWLWSIDPLATYQQISSALLDGVDELQALGLAGGTPVASGGRLNMAGALTALTPQVLIITATDASADEPSGETGTFTILRSGPATDPVTIHFTITGTATNGTDYATIPTSVTMAAGESEAIVTVTPIADALVEGIETVVLTLSGNATYAIGAPNSATVNILDTALPVVTITATDAAAAEINNPGAFTITRSGPTTAELTVNFTVGGTATNGTDYTAIATSATIPIGASSATVTINPVNDGVPEPTETVMLALSDNSSYLVGAPNTATVTIADGLGINFPPDLQPIADLAVPPEQQVVNVPLSVTDPNSDPISFTATAQSLAYLVSQQNGPFTYFPVYDNFYGQQEKWLQVPSGQWYFLLSTGEFFRWDNSAGANGPAVGVVGVGYYQDPTRLQNPAANDPHATLAFADNTLTITRDLAWGSSAVVTVTASDGHGGSDTETFTFLVTSADLPTVTITATDANAGEPANAGTFTVTRSGPTTAALTVNFTVGGTASNGTDYTAIATSMTIPIGASFATVTINPIDDAAFEGDETAVVSLSTGSYLADAPRTATVTIADNDLPAVTITATDASAGETSGGTNAGTFTISRSGPTTAALTVNFTVGGTASNGTDYTTILLSVTIPIGAPSATVTINPIDDALSEGIETVVLTLSANSSYVVGTPGAATVNIADNDNLPPVLEPIANFTVPSAQQEVTVPLAASDPDSDPVTFTATAQSLAWVLTQQIGQFVYHPEFDNYYGQNEKWFQPAPEVWYFLLPTGELFRWNNTSGANGISVGVIGVSYYQDPSRLQNAAADDAHVTLVISGNTLTITRDLAWVSGIVITVTASDGLGGTDTESFTVFVSA